MFFKIIIKHAFRIHLTIILENTYNLKNVFETKSSVCQNLENTLKILKNS